MLYLDVDVDVNEMNSVLVLYFVISIVEHFVNLAEAALHRCS